MPPNASYWRKSQKKFLRRAVPLECSLYLLIYNYSDSVFSNIKIRSTVKQFLMNILLSMSWHIVIWNCKTHTQTSTRCVKYKYLKLISKYDPTQPKEATRYTIRPAAAEARNWLIWFRFSNVILRRHCRWQKVVGWRGGWHVLHHFHYLKKCQICVSQALTALQLNSVFFPLHWALSANMSMSSLAD